MVQGLNFSSEYAAFLSGIFILFMMLASTPKRTRIYTVNIIGVICSLIGMVLYRSIMAIVQHPHYYSRPVFDTLIMLFMINYTIIVSSSYGYIDQLSYAHKEKIKILNIKITIFYIVSLCVYCYLLFSGSMYIVDETGITLTPWFYIFLIFGMFTIACIIGMLIAYRHTYAKRVLYFMYVFIPIELLLLLFQFHHNEVVLVSIICLAPFIVFYILFHSNPFDETSGCQNTQSLSTRFYISKRTKKQYITLIAQLPRYKNTKHLFDACTVERVIAKRCRQVTSFHKHSYVFTLSDYEFLLFINIDNNEDCNHIIKQVIDICNSETNISQRFIVPVYRLIAFKGDPSIDTFEKMMSFREYLFNKMGPNAINECYVAKEDDYNDFTSQYKISRALMQIKVEGNLDDEHVLCYAQPILKVSSNSFRTAEALMRLKIGDDIIYPDKFIPAAEQSNCIHMLTTVMINKVCKIIQELSPEYDFDAITVNCSTTEFSNPNFYKEILDIIQSYDIDSSKICLELTESAMIDDYDMILHNIKKLKENGIHFYLDDFGTGYSNLEKIITCPFKTIKFDKSLLYKSMDDEALDDLMHSMVDVFKRQGFNLLVEGVETTNQNDYSVQTGFDYIQGYKYSKPIPIEKLVEFFDKK